MQRCRLQLLLIVTCHAAHQKGPSVNLTSQSASRNVDFSACSRCLWSQVRAPRAAQVWERGLSWQLNPQPSPHFESPVNCNRRLAFLLIDARYASPAACECSNAIVVSKGAGRQFVLFARLFPDRREKTAPNSGPLKNEGIHEVCIAHAAI